jgi:hypothetical protein
MELPVYLHPHVSLGSWERVSQFRRRWYEMGFERGIKSRAFFTSEATFDNLIAEEGHRRRRRLSLVLMEALMADKRRYRGI